MVCPICGKIFDGKEKLLCHQRDVHDLRDIKCEVCGLKMRGIKQLNNHMKNHEFTKCKSCGKDIKFNSRTSHMAKCGNTNLKCNKCPFFTKYKHHLKNHVQKCGIEKVDTVHRCPECGKTLLNLIV